MVGTDAAGAAPAYADARAPRFGSSAVIAPGVAYRTFTVVGHRLEGAAQPPFTFAVGGFPIVRDDRQLPGLDTATAAVRTAAGIADGGHRLHLVALDGGPDTRAGRRADDGAQPSPGRRRAASSEWDRSVHPELIPQTPGGALF